MGKMRRTRHPKETKEAVIQELYNNPRKQVITVSRKYGVKEKTIHTWLSKEKKLRGKRGDSIAPEAGDELEKNYRLLLNEIVSLPTKADVYRISLLTASIAIALSAAVVYFLGTFS